MSDRFTSDNYVRKSNISRPKHNDKAVQAHHKIPITSGGYRSSYNNLYNNSYGKVVSTQDSHERQLNDIGNHHNKRYNKPENKPVSGLNIQPGEATYVVSALAKYKYDKPEDGVKWVYLGYSDEGVMNTEYPVWVSASKSKKFYTIREAKEAWERDKLYMLGRDYELIPNSLAVRKITYKEIEKLR